MSMPRRGARACALALLPWCGAADGRPALPGDDRQAAAARRLAEAERLWSEGRSAEDAERALAAYRDALELWTAAGEPGARAVAARRLGEALLALGQSGPAVAALRQALSLGREAGDPETECLCLSALILAEVEAGALPDAQVHAQQALGLGLSSASRRCEAAAQNAAGEVASFTGRTPDAPTHYERAIAIGRQLGDRRIEARALLNLGYAMADLSRLAEARSAYESALAGWRSVGDRRGEARTLIGLAQAHGIAGEKQEALRRYDEARGLVASLGDRWGQAVVESGMGAAYFQLGDPESSIGHYTRAVELFRAAGVRYGEAANRLHLGASLAALGRREEALAEEGSALTIARSLKDARLEARALQRIGQIQADLGRLDDALASQRQAATIARGAGDVRAESEALSAIGELVARGGCDEQARRSFADARGLAREARDRYSESKALFGLARISSACGRLDDAVEEVRASLALVEDLRADVASLELRASYMASIRDRHELEIDLHTRRHALDATQGHDARAFEAAEAARARSLLDALAGVRAGIHEGVDPALLAREVAVRQQLNAIAGRLARLTRAEREAAPELERAVDALRLEDRELRGRLRAVSPRHAGLLDPRPLSLADIQGAVLDEQSVLLQYFVGQTRSYMWAVARGSLTSRVLPGAREMEDVVRPYLATLAEPAAPRGARSLVEAHEPRPDATAAAAVSRMLLDPVADQIDGRRILVVADGVLEGLPFAALPNPRSAPAADEQPRPLLRRHEIVTLPSASTLALVRAAGGPKAPWQQSVAVFADPIFEADDPRLPPRSPRAPSGGGLRGSERPGAFPRLLGSAHEARRIAAAVMASDLWIGARATRSSALEASLGRHRVVHFATHAYVDAERPELSSIVLSLYDERGEPRDGFLRLNDVYNMRLPVDLVVLSACSSALGKPVAGEGLTSLVRGFMYAGARRVLASLWKVDDEATAELMAHFYEGLWRRGLSPSAALREAQLAISSQRRWRDPFYWAAFVVSGDWEP
jgi:CHAT domain-containing protein/tetratricopeptide (TPR) repeat protein